MSREILETKRKALKLNLNPAIYGTFAEIGAGQEVARNFFTAGAASGTVAKTISAYDMAFSNSIYGAEEDGRYVSQSRLNKMLHHEFELLAERLCGPKYDERTFFAFANTVTTLNYSKTNDPHGWLGIRFQVTP
ncbi:MAG TPA: nicotinamide mononucleotide adenylyltransferase, partial [Sphingobacteriaceae bacterium]